MVLGFATMSLFRGGLLLTMVMGFLSLAAVPAAYFGLMYSLPGQATLGKMAVGIKVVREDGAPFRFMFGFLRGFGLILSCLPLFVGVIAAAFSERKRAWHDATFNTLVVDRWAFTDQPQLQPQGFDIVNKIFITLLVLSVVIVVGALGFFIIVMRDYLGTF